MQAVIHIPFVIGIRPRPCSKSFILKNSFGFTVNVHAEFFFRKNIVEFGFLGRGSGHAFKPLRDSSVIVDFERYGSARGGTGYFQFFTPPPLRKWGVVVPPPLAEVGNN